MDKHEITQELLKEHFEYHDGHLFWIKPTAKSVKIGQQFGSYDNRGYRIGWLKGKKYYEHRLIWFYHCGVWPKDELDHINIIPDDNRIENLREATRQQNNFNRKSFGKTSKYKGVYWHKRDKKWQAQYRYNGKRHYLGLFTEEKDAAKAYDEATKPIHQHFHKENISEVPDKFLGYIFELNDERG